MPRWWRHGDGEQQQRAWTNTGTLKANGGTLDAGWRVDNSGGTIQVASGVFNLGGRSPRQLGNLLSTGGTTVVLTRTLTNTASTLALDGLTTGRSGCQDDCWRDGDGGERRGADDDHVRQRR